jgi:hypothetical protein
MFDVGLDFARGGGAYAKCTMGGQRSCNMQWLYTHLRSPETARKRPD